MEIDRSQFLDKIYTLINNQGKKYGDYKKCEFHIHTPESKCYRFRTPEDKLDAEEDLEGKNLYSKLTLENIIDYGLEIGFFTKEGYLNIKNDYKEYSKMEVVKELNNIKIKYKSFKEYITYEMIAFKLYEKKINVAVISDHNTIAGYDKLLCAINEYDTRTNFNKKHKLKVMLGVEISCSDKNHLMVIIDDSKKKKLQKKLDEIIMGDNLGSFLDTRTIIKELSKLNPIMYIAHANTSDFYGNEVYKKELLNSEDLNGFGLKDIIQKENIINRTKIFNNNIREKAFVLEADSHAINEMGRKNAWIKLSTLDFNALKKAFLNHKVCIFNEQPNKTNIQINGLVIERGERGFLGEDPNRRNDKHMVVDFSSDLNCIIGGKGTGKSTILNILEIIYSRETDDIELLNFISQHKRIYSLFTLDNEEYILYFIPQVHSEGGYSENLIVNRNSYIKKGNSYQLTLDWYYLFKRTNTNNKIKYIEIPKLEISIVLKRVFKRGYNINKLVNKINSNEISDYIREVMTNNVNYEEINSYIRKIKAVNANSLFKEVRESITDIIEMINRRKTEFDLKIKEFNKQNINIIQIKYTPINTDSDVLNEFLEIFGQSRIRDDYYTDPKELDRSVCDTYLTWGDLQNYFSESINYFNFFEILTMILNYDLLKMNQRIPLRKFEGIEENYKTIDRELVHINDKKINEINKEILFKFKVNRELFKDIIIKSFKVLDKFEIYFNVNYREDVAELPKDFKNIRNLSSGQKVAALLRFVLSFGAITNDSTPLIIDQPEDNLDNTYIYKTLVESLRAIKNKRQVILVTHSSTIVINADAEEVIVLKSNNKKGWIEKHGYPSEKTITNHILNYLEGGKESFNHKYNMYKTILGS